MKRRDFLHSIGWVTAGMTLQGCASFPAKTSRDRARELPNIVVIMADDMGYGDLTCLNEDSKIPTPHMDRLAREGIIFTDAHSPSAVCTPTRYGLLTGRYCWRTRLKSGVLWGWSPPLIDPARMTIASLLKRNGYNTACVGKWHLGLGWQTEDGSRLSDRTNEVGDSIDYSRPIQGGPTDLGFDYFFGIPASLDMVPYCFIENDRPVLLPTNTIEASGYPAFYRGGPIAPGFEFKQVLPIMTKKAIEYMERCATSDPQTPFFLYMPLTAPHTPWVPNEFVKGKSQAGVYGDFVVEVDWAVGQILKTLDVYGFAENTLVILTSDNGAHETHIGEFNNGNSSGHPNWGHEANYYFRGQKADIWDGGHRIPFIARWPGRIRAGTSCDDTICLTDLIATCAAITSTPLPDNAAEDSYNLLPLLLGEKRDKPLREATVHHSLHGMFSIRQKPWKLILGRGSGGFTKPREIQPGPGEPIGQLYNVEEDVREEHNLYLERPDVVERLTQLLEKYKNQGYSRPI